ncbi:MAG: TonB-dependent receptor plug domain-containing protein [Candidatus Marinimicrobia bacterium]|nr:TonB-dependent receptor plug domain-containing protein [Candidatus Neomarinimicrobiota bacterium]
MKYKVFTLIFSLFVIIQLFGQNIIIDGTVIDSTDNKPIQNVNISMKNSYIGTITDDNGYFRLSIDTSKIESRSLIISHVKYKYKKIKFNDIKDDEYIKLVEKVFQFKNISIYGNINKFEYKQEIRNAVTSISSASFEDVGNIDVSDVLKSEQSIHIDEKLNGEKNISIRGSNSDEVVILYDGIPINNNFNNYSDLSLINENILDHIDIIKGSNVASMGAYNSSAVINFVPKYKQDYLVKFNQQFGSYNSGKWNLNLHKDLFGINMFSGIGNASSKLNYVDTTANSDILNTSSNITAGLSIPFGKTFKEKKQHNIKANFLQNERKYENGQISDTLETDQTLINLKFSETFKNIGESSFYFSQQNSNQAHSWIYNDSSRKRILKDNTNIFQGDHIYDTENISIFLAYQNKQSKISETYNENKETFQRSNNNVSGGLQFKNAELSYPFDLKDVQFSFKYEDVSDSKIELADISAISDSIKSHWREKSFMISTSFIGAPKYFLYKVNFNYSSGFRIPSLLQQVTALRFPITEKNNTLLTEYKSNFEIVNTLSINKFDSNVLSEILLTFSIFTNSYQNKMRMIHLKGSSVQYFDNYNDAQIYGIESSFIPLFADGICKLNFSASKYFIENKLAFPFKPTDKLAAGLIIATKMFNFSLQFFHESGSMGLIVNEINDDGVLLLKEMEIDSFESLDIQLKKEFKLWRFNTYISVSGKNILNDKMVLEGIALKDRRFYLSGGIEFK